jgi:hypothetical protein
MRHLLTILPFVILQFGFNFGGFFNGISTLLGTVARLIAQVFAFLWNVLVTVFNFLLELVTLVFNFFLKLALGIRKMFTWLWEHAVKRVFVKALDAYLKLRAWLEKVFAPIIRWINRIRAIIDHYYRLYVRPLLNLIQHIRQTLTVFRLLGFKWAERLDARLAGIERKIAEGYTLIVTNLNQAISYLQLIGDSVGILRRNPVIGALIRSAGELRNLLDRVGLRDLTLEEEAAQKKAAGRFSRAAVKGDFTEFYSKGKIPPEVRATNDEVKRRIAALAGAPHG